MSTKLQLLVLSDTKPGHLNQSLGLAEAMARLRPAEISVVEIDFSNGIFARIRAALREAEKHPKPDYIIAAGHSTHLPLLWIARKLSARSVVLMKPSLPLAWFDWCIAPEHDFPTASPAANLITSKGALNRVVARKKPRKGRLFLIGGPSKSHEYDEAALLAQIRSISAEGSWQLADSRRTPPSLLTAVRKELPQIEIFPHQQTKPGWLAEKLAELEEIHVTEDSVSMIYEALSGGAKVGVLAMPRRRENSRVAKGLAKLADEGYFSQNGISSPPILAEADRCAALILAAQD